MTICSRCKKEKPEEEFRNLRGGIRKTCISCAAKRRRKIDPNAIFCKGDDCKNVAYHNFPGELEPEFCEDHKTDDMTLILTSKCRELGCDKRCQYGFKNGKKYYCKDHKKFNMIDLSRAICIVDDCTTRATYGEVGSKKPIYCVSHIQGDAVDIANIKCLECSTRAGYNFLGEKRPLYCAAHKKDDMICITNDICEYDGCKKSAAFGFLEEGKFRRCSEHKEDGMTNIKSKICEYPGCTTQATCNIPEETAPKFCAEHKEKNMIDVKNRCKQCEKCDKRANFGLDSDQKPRFCAEHKEDDMEDMVHKKCEEDDCKTQATFGYKGKPPIRCAAHKTPDMLDLTKKICDTDKCTARAYYGFLGGQLIKCQRHRQEGMIKNPRRKCKEQGCKNLATHGIAQTTHCEEHMEEDEINLVEHKCPKCKSVGVLSPNGICVNFCEDDELYKKHKKFQKLKQLRIQNLLTKKIPKKLSYVEQTVNTSHTNERVDFLYECKTHNTSVDVDEFAHRNYCTPKGEFGRMINLFFALGQDKPTIFIRYNPDHFRVDGKRQNITDKEREETLIHWVKHYLKNSPEIKDHPEYKCFILYLFYDEYDKNNIKLYPFDPYTLTELECETCEKPFFIQSMYEGHKCIQKRPKKKAS